MVADRENIYVGIRPLTTQAEFPELFLLLLSAGDVDAGVGVEH